jgi:hypothetical protein
MALGLAAAGANVCIAARGPEGLQETPEAIAKLGRKGESISADVTHEKEVEKAISHVLDRFQRIDILVNNAGWDKIEPFIKNTPEFWDKVIAINLKGPIFAPGCLRSHDRAEIRQGHQHQFRCRKSGKHGRSGLFRLQGRHHRFHQDHRPRNGPLPNKRQLRLPRLGRHAYDPLDHKPGRKSWEVGTGLEPHASDRPHGRREGNRRGHRFPGQ